MRGTSMALVLGVWLGGAFGCEDKFELPADNLVGAGGEADAMAGSSMTGAGSPGTGGAGGEVSEAGAGGEVRGPGAAGDDSGGAGGEAGTPSDQAPTCPSTSCAMGENCVANQCVPALVSC